MTTEQQAFVLFLSDELRRLHALFQALIVENETLRTGYDAARLEIESLQKAATDRHALQATGAHPAPCARYCEAQAFFITMRNLHAEIERLRTCNKDAQHEIANLQERVQELGQMARDVNSRRVVELEAQLAAVGAGGVEPLRKRECLHQITEPDHFRGATKLIAAARQAREALDWLPTSKHSQALWHRQQPALAAIREALEAEPQPAAQAAPEDASARFKAQHEFLVWNREQTPSPIESATEYSVFNQAVDFYLAARAAQGGA